MNKHTFSMNTKQKQAGFSLLELTLVLLIMGVMASVSLSFVEEKDSEQRFQESVTKLKALNRYLFYSTQTKNNYLIERGFVLDNGYSEGLLSDAVLNGQWQNYYRYNRYPVHVTLDDKGNSELLEEVTLNKGYRRTLVDLADIRDTSNHIRDGWGAEFTLDGDSAKINTQDLSFKSAFNFTMPFELFIDFDSFTTTYKNPGDTKNFRLAIVSFINCPLVEGEVNPPQACWQTLLSDEKELTKEAGEHEFIHFLPTNITDLERDLLSDEEKLALQPKLPLGEHLAVLLYEDSAKNEWQVCYYKPGIPGSEATKNVLAEPFSLLLSDIDSVDFKKPDENDEKVRTTKKCEEKA